VARDDIPTEHEPLWLETCVACGGVHDSSPSRDHASRHLSVESVCPECREALAVNDRGALDRSPRPRRHLRLV